MSARAVILGAAGPTLEPDEAAFLREADPWGFIIFKRSVEDPEQLKRLTGALRDCVGRNAPVLVDQEGGRVQRIGPPNWKKRPPGRVFGELYKQDPEAAVEAARLNFQLIGHELAAVGIDVDCVPNLDIGRRGANKAVVGDRVLGEEPEPVIALGRAVLEGLAHAGLAGVIKHMPGHGRATVDSHFEMPRAEASAADLEATDCAPFAALKDAPMAMTAHLLYPAWDENNPATTSPTIVSEIMRGKIGFGGLLMTDDISMKALGGTFEERARRALAADCDVVLHCNADRAEMEGVLAATPALEGKALARAERAEAARGTPQAFDADAAEARLAELIGGLWGASGEAVA
ncbi:MAG: beta-N-acetylhexosaminidase [Maricaulaceae bacterium]|jgi:beta-N-acetylhexosaminidase